MWLSTPGRRRFWVRGTKWGLLE